MGRPPIDLTGQRFGKLTALEIYEHGGAHHPVKWKCICDCGKEKMVDSQLLRRNIIIDCGCGVTNWLVGQRFGHLTVIRDSNKRFKSCGNIIWECKCDCGNITYVSTGNLKAEVNKTVSCGCVQAQNRIKHNYTVTNPRLYKIYSSMKQRCYNRNSDGYKWYGARGIKICDEWLGEKGAENFCKWALENGYTDFLEIDRIDNNKNYEPLNCRWTTRKGQMQNTRQNHWITIDGEKHIISDWAKLKGISLATIYSRLQKGMSEYDAIMTPVKRNT